MTSPTAPIDALSEPRARFLRILPHHFERLTWSADQLHAWQTRRLRALLAMAIARSPYHASRLAGVDPARIEMSDLTALPIMSKIDMMDRYDDVVTDPRLTRARVEAHLQRIVDGPQLIDGRFLPIATGGSSGVRGIFTYDRESMVEFFCGVLRAGLAAVARESGWPPPHPVPLALVAAPSAVHATRALMPMLDGAGARATYAPATLPLTEIARRLQEAQPAVIAGYATTIARLADEQAAGRLAIAPKMVICTSEQLTADLVQRIIAGLGVPPVNSFACSEGLTATAPPGDDVFSFASDLSIVEFVDDRDRPVTRGEQAHHILTTNLFNHTQPLIRYRLDDAMIQAGPAETHGHARARLTGRVVDPLTIRGVDIHPLTISSVILKHGAIMEYQVCYSDAVVRIHAVAATDATLDRLVAEVTGALARAGVTGVPVTARRVDRITRDAHTGKARRFIPC